MNVCQVCDKSCESVSEGEVVTYIGFVCQECLDNAEDITGYCSMSCQLFGQCDGSC